MAVYDTQKLNWAVPLNARRTMFNAIGRWTSAEMFLNVVCRSQAAGLIWSPIQIVFVLDRSAQCSKMIEILLRGSS